MGLLPGSCHRVLLGRLTMYVDRNYVPLPNWEKLRDLTPEENTRYRARGFVKYEMYESDNRGSQTGKFWTQAELDRAARKKVTVDG